MNVVSQTILRLCKTRFISLVRQSSILMCAALTLGLLGTMTVNAAPQDRWAGDVPIMDGLTIEPELGFAFDSPSGRIVMIFVSSDKSVNELHAFYDTALVSLGWVGGQGQWKRGPEKLSIEQVDTAVGMLWRIMVRPG